jgi:hypothetical protein
VQIHYFETAADTIEAELQYEARVKHLSKSDLLEEADRALLLLKPAYLGDIYHTSYSVASGTMLKYIKKHAIKWSPVQYNAYPVAFREYFRPHEKGHGYVLKHSAVAVDHIIPASLGGIDHPRNYALMPARLNQSYGNRSIVEKFSLVPRTVRIKVCAFARSAQDATREQREAWLSTLGAEDGAQSPSLSACT